MPTHYIAIAGLHGCIPASCEVYDTYDDAVDELASLHELGRKRTHALRWDGSLELNLRRDGNEYCEIVECNCADPSQHSDAPLRRDR